MAGGTDELGAVADELYGLPAAEFTAARNAAAKAAKSSRSAGSKELAAAISALPKPSTAAWVVNQLVRRHSRDVDALLELGADLRAAERARDPDRIRSLSRERNLLVPALARQATALAAELGQPVSDPVAAEIEGTLTAALATEEFGAAVRSGRLTKALVWAGFGEMPALATLVAVPSGTRAPRNAGAADAADDAADDAAADTAADESARRVAEERARELAAAREAAAEADRRVAELTQTAERLAQQLAQARERLADAESEAAAAARRVTELTQLTEPSR